MPTPPMARRAARLVCLVVLLSCAVSAFAFQERQRFNRFAGKERVAPHAGLPNLGRAAVTLAPESAARQAWDQFLAEQGGGWDAWFDGRSGLPGLLQGRGIPWIAGGGNRLAAGDAVTVDRLETLARAFLAAHPALLGRFAEQLVLDREASGRLGPDAWQVTFRQSVGGVRVDGARYDFQVVHGNLVSFGASAMLPVQRDVHARVAAVDARAALDRYLGVAAGELAELAPVTLVLLPVDPRNDRTSRWDGPFGAGYTHALAWRFTLKDGDDPATWVAEVSADTGEILGFYDDTKYDRIAGGVFPVSDDGLCPDGCEQAGYPLPFADFSENGGPTQYTGNAGVYSCTSSGATINTRLIGPYIRVSDSCGQANETTTCDNPLDFGTGPGTDCTVPAGSSPGNTHAGRSSFYHLNRSMERGRAWLPANTWLQSQVTDNINIFSTCNAYWNGSVNFYRSGGGCRNTGEIAGVFVHEWGHGLDSNDGGGYDNPSEAYADIVALLYTRVSCVGRGFYMSQNCSGYGDACLDCTGIRDQDWNMHQSHSPANAAWVQAHCGGGGGACGAEPHCESYIAAETIYDLASRDLPAAGMDTASAWQHVDQLWYLSRNGSGGNAYNCSGASSDGCASTSWFSKFRQIDDDDGNLANGTPHAAAIYAAFARHGIACGTAADASNQNSSACPVLAQPQISVGAGSNSNTVQWAAVPGAVSYNVLRNDMGCEYGQTTIGQPAAPATTFVDTPVPNGFTLNYRVQAVGAQRACVSPVSDCVTSAAQPFAGAVSFDKGIYPCSATLGLRVTDGNVGAPTIVVLVWSDTEPTPEAVTLTQVAPGAAKYTGAIVTTGGPAVHGDGALSIKAGDVMAVTYFDQDDGTGHAATTFSTATLDCAGPLVTELAAQAITDARATIHYKTTENATTVVDWGTTPALGNTFSASTLTTTHDVLLNKLATCQDVYYRIRATDAYGNAATIDNHGVPFVLHTGLIPGLYFKDTFESNGNNWTLGGEWQIGAPQGKGGSSGLPDPTSAYNNDGVLGHDLTGLGANPGDYEPNKSESAKSKVLNSATWHHMKLMFYRRLQSGQNDEASIWVWYPTGRPLFLTKDAVADTDYTLQTFDLSQLDGSPTLQVEFREKSDQSGSYSGWNIDDLIIKDGSLPDYGACSNCGAAPSFAGAKSAVDNNACGATGVTVSWDGAAGWGSGSTGSYAVYRGTAPGFAADAAHLVVKGVGGSSYNDTAAPAGQLYYLVRAESDETCSSGPNNHGVTDGNTTYVPVLETASRPLPGTIGTLGAANVARTHVRLTWSAPSDAATYHVYRSATPQSPGTGLATTTGTYYDDLGAVVTPDSYFYLVRGVNACGNEGP